MSDLDGEVEREIIYDHYSRPRRFGKVGEGACLLENPSCGDLLRLELAEGEPVSLRFEGKGCSISQASASMMAELLSGKSREEAIEIAQSVLAAFRGDLPPESLERYGDVSALAGVAKLPVRVKCAALAWSGALKALQGGSRRES
jgi:nitrogen fixation protein NifU and related proteins